MRIIHLSYTRVAHEVDPHEWLKKIHFSAGILEAMAAYGEIHGIHHIRFKGIVKKNGVTYHFRDYSRLQLLVPFQFNSFVRRLDPDVVTVHGLISPWQVILLRWSLGSKVRIVCQHHAERPFHDFRKYIQRWADRYIHAYQFCAAKLALNWVQTKQIKTDKKIHEVMEGSSLFRQIDKESAQKMTGVSGDQIFIWVGRLDANKDPLTVVRAFIQYARHNSSASLYMIYQTTELLAGVKREIALASANDYIHLIGKVPHDSLELWYSSADFIISGSHYEGSGIAICEAIGCGCIPIVTDIPSFGMMTDKGRIGMLYPAGDEKSLGAVLSKTSAIDKPRMKADVLAWFDKRLSFEAIAKDSMAVINSITHN